MTGDSDHFRASVPAEYRIDVAASFAHAEVDLDLYLWSADGSTLHASSTSGADGEEINWSNPFVDDVEVVIEAVIGAGGAPTGCGDYELEIENIFTPCFEPDRFEPNDTCATAVPITPDGASFLHIYYNNADWFTLTVPPNVALTTRTLAFFSDPSPRHRIWSDDCLTMLAQSTTSGASQQTIYENTTGGPLDVRIQAYSEADVCCIYAVSFAFDSSACTSRTVIADLRDHSTCRMASSPSVGFGVDIVSLSCLRTH